MYKIFTRTEEIFYQKKDHQRNHTEEQRTKRSTFRQDQPAQGGLFSKSVKKETPEGRIEGDFGTGVKSMALPEIGTDENVLPVSLLDPLNESHTFVPVHTFKKPLKISMEVKGEGMSIEISRKEKLSVKLKLTVGPLKLRTVLWIVPENEMDEVLLARPIMKALGFDAI